MAINRLKLVISILRELEDGNIPNEEDYGIDRKVFFDTLEAMQDKNLIKGVSFSRGGKKGILIAFLDDAKITIDGMEYLHNNSTLVKTYKGLKEVREWLPF